MEMKEADRVVIAKPVASRPSCSSFRSFSELLASAVNASPSNVCTETTVAPIRPKTARFKTTKKGAPAGLVSPQADINAAAVCNSSDKVSESDSKPIVVYKPLAKLVSKTTVSLLANMGNFQTSQCSHQQTLQSIGAPVKHQNQDKQNFRSPFSSNLQISSRAETDEAIVASKTALQNLADDPRSSILTNHVDRPSFDGYNWRKYGQKQVKGSEYPRSYYKCTHPNCPVKKKVERSFDGQIAEIVYKGEHNHLKPQPQKRNSSGTQGLGLGFVPDQTGQDAGNPNESSEGRVENRNELGFPADPIYRNIAPVGKDFVMSGEINGGTPENSCGVSGECEEGSKGMEVEDDEHRSKRRKSENQSNEARISGEGIGGQEARIAVQSSTDSEILGDGFRWRKYGQKVVKGNPYPRSYYRCTSLKCNVRKHVERTSDDPKAFITTYEGKHNHGMPLKNTNTNSAASEPDSCKEKP